MARFSLELIVFFIAILAVFINFSLFNHAYLLTSSDQSVIFSFVKKHPSLNNLLAYSNQTTTILSFVDRQILRSSLSSSVVLASTTADDATVVEDGTTIQDSVVVKTNPADTENFSRHGLTTYQVAAGDTIVGIAQSFGISPQTIMMENKLDQSSIIKPGQELTILPTTGITLKITSTDSLESIVKKFKVSEDDFLDANNIETFEDLALGSIVVIPMDNISVPTAPRAASRFVVDTSNRVALKQASAPSDFVGGLVDFIWPTSVRNITQGFSSRHSGLDISNSRMEPIYAAADGFVEASGFQANGYGNTVIINHGNGYKTRYAHASSLSVQAGDYVAQGQEIGKQGRTGRVRGVTGIHLHFEIIKNGVKVNPFSYVKP